MSQQGRRIAIVAVHGIGNHEPYAHACAVADGLKDALDSGSATPWKCDGGHLHVAAEGTGINDLPPRMLVLTPEDGGASGIASIDIIEPTWAQMTKGFTSHRRLWASVRGAVDTIQTAWRRTSRKTAAEGLVIFILTALLFGGVFAGPIGALQIAMHLGGAWYDTLVVAAAILVIARLLFDAASKIWNWRGYGQLFQFYMVQHPDEFFLMRVFNAHFYARGNLRPHQWLTFGMGIALCYPAAILTALCAVYAMWRHLAFQPTASFGWFTVWFVMAAVGPTCAARVSGAMKTIYGPLEDVYTMCTFAAEGYGYTRRNGVLESVAQHILNVLGIVRLDDGVTPYYDEVYVLGHSMGSFIAMRAILLVQEAVSCGALKASDYQRIKGLVTYGAAVEKIMAHFGLQDLKKRPLEIGALVQVSHAFGADKIPWLNVYYLSDIVADPISFSPDVCENVCLPGSLLAVWSHSSYFHDRRFWHTVLKRAAVPLSDSATTSSQLSVWSRLLTFFGRMDSKPLAGTSGPTTGGTLRMMIMTIILYVAIIILQHTRNINVVFLTALLTLGGLLAIQFTIPEIAVADGKDNDHGTLP